jgi:hypothetical protein
MAGKVKLSETQRAVMDIIPDVVSIQRWKVFIVTNATQRTLDVLKERGFIAVSYGSGSSDDCWLKKTPAGRAHLASSGKTGE